MQRLLTQVRQGHASWKQEASDLEASLSRISTPLNRYRFQDEAVREVVAYTHTHTVPDDVILITLITRITLVTLLTLTTPPCVRSGAH